MASFSLISACLGTSLAYFQNGRIAEAISTERAALDRIPEDDAEHRAGLEQQLAKFEAGAREGEKAPSEAPDGRVVRAR